MKKIAFLTILGLGMVLFLQSCSPYYYDRAYYPSRTVHVRPAAPYYNPAPRVYVQKRPYRSHHRHYKYR